MMTNENWRASLGDMSPESFREHAHQIVDWIAEYLRDPPYPVLSSVRPGDVSRTLPPSPPSAPEDMGVILEDFENRILPGITHWNHPGFLAYFAITGSAPGILAEFLSAALNVNAMLWRTSPAATELEEVTLSWLGQLLGLPATFSGVIYDTASISTLVALAAAREQAAPATRERGLVDGPRLRLYTSVQAHSSVERAALVLGLGTAGVCTVPSDAEFRMDAFALRLAVEEDLRAGRQPFCVVGTVGTTSTTSVDPIPAIADICEEFGLWLHVDGAYGGMAAMLPERAWVFEGVERADSVVVNPHKWLFTPIDLSAFYSRRLDVVRDAFSLVPEYLRTPEEEVRNYMDYGPQLGRRFRALKLWFVLRSFGRDGLVARLREHLRLAQLAASWIEDSPNWELLAPVPFSTLCFRYAPPGTLPADLNEINAAILAQVNSRGRVYLSHTVLNGKYAIRIAVGNLRTTEDHLREAWEELQTVATNASLARP